MVQKSLAILVAGLFIAKPDTLGAQEWKKYIPQNKKYEVEFPGTPKLKKSKGFTHASVGVPAKRAVFGVEERDFVRKVVFSEALLKSLLDSARNGTMRAYPNTRLLSEKNTKFGMYRGRETMFRTIIGFQRVQYIVTPTRYYTVYVIGAKDYCEGETGQRFFKSFKPTE